MCDIKLGGYNQGNEIRAEMFVRVACSKNIPVQVTLANIPVEVSVATPHVLLGIAAL